MWIDLAFVFGGFLIDHVIRLTLPVDSALRLLVFVPNLGFLTFLFVSLKKPMLQALMMAVLLGFLVDMTRLQPFTNMLAYPLSVYVVKEWSNQLNESLFEQVFIGTIGLFIKELILYVILMVLSVTKIHPYTWFVKREFLTLIGHIPLLIGLTLLNRTRIESQDKLNKQRQRRESIRWTPTVKP